MKEDELIEAHFHKILKKSLTYRSSISFINLIIDNNNELTDKKKQIAMCTKKKSTLSTNSTWIQFIFILYFKKIKILKI